MGAGGISPLWDNWEVGNRMIPWWLDVRVLDGYVSILKLRRLTRGVYGWRLSLLGCILKLHWSSIQVDAGAGECMSVGFCSPPLGYIRGFRRSFQDRMSAQPGFILCPPTNPALHCHVLSRGLLCFIHCIFCQQILYSASQRLILNNTALHHLILEDLQCSQLFTLQNVLLYWPNLILYLNVSL